ncbi:polysaccharide deacetylase family protein [Agarivorans aestuarii]|uniref:polysaccharide deacetylase family protein n=1 Tax=Agarivorans aestuarii TaxID=1563703 RepID=UPI001C825E0A|nr:polysaccharide deacetylase family protein [Agarivorans aestuarii]
MNRVSKLRGRLKKYFSFKGSASHHYRNGLYVFNYHRIGNPAVTEFDPNVFSCSVENFEEHLKFYKSNFCMLDEKGLLELFSSESGFDKPYAMITFDDGYVDCFEHAYPLLLKHNMSAVFFIVTNFADGVELAWWDKVAYLLKNTTVKQIQLPHWSKPCSIVRDDIGQSIKIILKMLKDDSSLSIEDKVSFLEQTCNVVLPKKVDLYLSWHQIEVMLKSGMAIGSHTLSHPILSHLSDEEQMNELASSKAKLATTLGQTPALFSYPVGKAGTFNQVSTDLANQLGYRLAFAFKGGVNTRLDMSLRYNIDRVSVDGDKSVEELARFILGAV